jgi:polyhydroxyalkanoate synthase
MNDAKERSSKAAPPATSDVSRTVLAALGQWTGGMSPQAFGGAWFNVVSRLALAPGRQLELVRTAVRKSVGLAQFATDALRNEEPVAPQAAGTPYAHRFADPAWARFPFNVLAQAFISGSELAREAVRNVPGVDPDAETVVGFTVREGLEFVAPDNYLPTNPQVIGQTVRERGGNLVRGAKNFAEDVQRAFKGLGPVGVENYQVGEQTATSKGKVILRNALMELIQYSPATDKVYAEPVLIVPAWIMKFYILDLSPKNSLVKYLTEMGHTVFMISWKNPTAEDRDVTMDDYVSLGVLAALAAIGKVVPKRKVHGVGYCIGGTLLAIAAALLAQREDVRLASMTLFAAQTDFSEPGELSVFISPAQLAMLEALMWKNGVLESRQMGGAFQLLRTYDLIWGPSVQSYLKGERLGVNDLMSWNADGTRMAYRMHTDYLHRPRRTVAFGLQGRQAPALEGLHVLPHERRPQRRHHQRPAAPEASSSGADDEGGRATAVAGAIHGEGRTGAGVLVAHVRGVAGRAFEPEEGVAAQVGGAGFRTRGRRAGRVRAREVGTVLHEARGKDGA